MWAGLTLGVGVSIKADQHRFFVESVAQSNTTRSMLVPSFKLIKPLANRTGQVAISFEKYIVFLSIFNLLFFSFYKRKVGDAKSPGS
jgi:hypothetical protein